MRILLLNGNTTQAITELCADAARAACGRDTRIVPVTATQGPQVIGTRTENAIAIAGLLGGLAAQGVDVSVLGLEGATE